MQKAKADWSFIGFEATGNETQQEGASQPFVYPLQNSAYETGRSFGRNPILGPIVGVNASLKAEGTVSAVFQWQSFGMPGDDEDPPEYVTFKIIASTNGLANRNTAHTTMPRDASGETVEASVLGVNATNSQSLVTGTQGWISKTEYKTVKVGSDGQVKSPPVSFKALAELPSNRYVTITMFGGMTYNSPVMGEVQIGVGVQISDPIERYVLITASDIEPSFYRSEIVPSQPVPEFRTGTPVPPSPGPYSIKNRRLSDGSIETGSFLDFQESTGEWFARSQFTANPTNLFTTNPHYEWSGIQDDRGPLENRRYIDVSSKKFSSGFDGVTPVTDTVKVKIVDTDDWVFTNAFKVTWHPPLESPVVDPSLPVISDIDYDESASPWTGMNLPISVPIRPRSIWWSAGTVGTGLAAAGAAVWPGGPPGAIAGLALVGASMTIAAVAPEDIIDPQNFGYDEYANAIERQYNINQNAPNTQNEKQRTFPASLANLAYPGLTDANHAADDPIWKNAGLEGRVIISRPTTETPWMADGYDQNGYQGIVRYTIKKQGTHDFLY